MYNTMYLIFTNLWFNIKMNCVFFFLCFILFGENIMFYKLIQLFLLLFNCMVLKTTYWLSNAIQIIHKVLQGVSLKKRRVLGIINKTGNNNQFPFLYK